MLLIYHFKVYLRHLIIHIKNLYHIFIMLFLLNILNKNGFKH